VREVDSEHVLALRGTAAFVILDQIAPDIAECRESIPASWILATPTNLGFGQERIVADAEITRFGATSGWPVTR